MFVLPGLVDSHTHPGLVARSVDYVELPWTPETKKEMFDALVAYADENPDKEFIVGGRWPTGLFGEEGPNRHELDAVLPDRPVILTDTSGHAQWLNTKALEVLASDFRAAGSSRHRRSGQRRFAGGFSGVPVFARCDCRI